MTPAFDRSLALTCARASQAAYELDDRKRAMLLGAAALHETGYIQARNDARVLIAETMAGDILWAFQGTQFERLEEESIAANLRTTPSPMPGGRSVMAGYKWQLDALADLLIQLPRPSIVTGHSLGGAVANLAANLVLGDIVPAVQLVTFGAPLCGDAGFWLWAPVLPTMRIEHESDPAPRWPPGPYIQPGKVWWLHAGAVTLCDHRPSELDLVLDWGHHPIARYIAALDALP